MTETAATISIPEAVALMRAVSRVFANKLRERDEAGNWLHYPAIRRYQEVQGKLGRRGSAVLVERADVLTWVEAQRRTTAPVSQVVAEGSAATYEDLKPMLLKSGACRTMKALGLLSNSHAAG